MRSSLAASMTAALARADPRQMYKGLRSKLLKGRGGADVDFQNAPLLQESRMLGNGRPKMLGSPEDNSTSWHGSRLQSSHISSAKC